MAMHALYKDNVAFLYKNVAFFDTLGAKRYISINYQLL